MEDEILELLNSTSLTDIILHHKEIEVKIEKLEHEIINLGVNDNINITENNKINLKQLHTILEGITEKSIRNSSIEELIKTYKKIQKLLN